MIPLAWNWARKNVTLLLLVSAMFCLALALGELIRGATWSLFMPVTLSAVVCGWVLGRSQLKAKQAWASLIVLGILGVFVFVGGLARPLGRLTLSIFSLIPQIIPWVFEQVLIDTSSVLVAWSELTNHIVNLFSHLWEWLSAIFTGRQFVDPLVSGLVWSIYLWLIGVWSSWEVRRNRQALWALTPGGVVLALVLDYSRGEVELLIVYLALMLALMGLVRVDWMHLNWERRKVSFSDSIRLETLAMVGVVSIALVLSAAGAPSISWRELLEEIRGGDQTAVDRAAETLGLERQPNVAQDEPYRNGGLPREHLLNTSPELLRDVVMTVSTGELPPIPETVSEEIDPNRYYWRAITYDVYSGNGWSSSAAEERSLPADTPLLAQPSGYRAVNQHIKRAGNSSNSLYWTGLLAQSDARLELAWRTMPPNEPNPLHYGDMLGGLIARDEYTLISYVPQYNADQLQGASSEYPPDILGRYLQLPESTPERVLALARELTQAAPTSYDRAAAIETYLRTFPYTLEIEPPPPDRDVVDYFLFTARQGYCDYYATSMVVMARAVGLPARIVIGYASGDYDAPTAEYIVRREHAHSWVEVYFAGFGWVEFEPTASQPVIDRGGGANASEPAPILPGGQPAFSWLKTQWRSMISSLGGQLLVVTLGFILLFTLWQVGEMSFLYMLPAQRAIAIMYFRMEKASANLLPDLPVGHTPHQLVSSLSLKLRGKKNQLLAKILSPANREIDHIVSLHVAQVFSEHPPTRTQVRKGVRSWIHLRWRLWLTNRWNRFSATRSRH